MKFVAEPLVEGLSHFPFSVTPSFLEVAIIELFVIPRTTTFCCKFSTLICPIKIQLLHIGSGVFVYAVRLVFNTIIAHHIVKPVKILEKLQCVGTSLLFRFKNELSAKSRFI